jgi:hypothetical protein
MQFARYIAVSHMRTVGAAATEIPALARPLRRMLGYVNWRRSLVKLSLCCYLIGFSLESVDVTGSVDGAINGDHNTYHFPTVFAKLGQLLL